MSDMKKYSISIAILFSVLLAITLIGDFLVAGTPTLIIYISIILISIIAAILLFSAIITKKVLDDKKVSPSLMKINYRIVKLLYPIIVVISELAGMSKSGIRRVFIKLNNCLLYTSDAADEL